MPNKKYKIYIFPPSLRCIKVIAAEPIASPQVNLRRDRCVAASEGKDYTLLEVAMEIIIENKSIEKTKLTPAEILLEFNQVIKQYQSAEPCQKNKLYQAVEQQFSLLLSAMQPLYKDPDTTTTEDRNCIIQLFLSYSDFQLLLAAETKGDAKFSLVKKALQYCMAAEIWLNRYYGKQDSKEFLISTRNNNSNDSDEEKAQYLNQLDYQKNKILQSFCEDNKHSFETFLATVKQKKEDLNQGRKNLVSLLKETKQKEIIAHPQKQSNSSGGLRNFSNFEFSELALMEIFDDKGSNNPILKTVPKHSVKNCLESWQIVFRNTNDALFMLAANLVAKLLAEEIPDFSFELLGSPAKLELAPRSDIEYCLLVKLLPTPNNQEMLQKANKIRQFLRASCQWFELAVILMGETKLTHVFNKELALDLIVGGYSIDEGNNHPLGKEEFITTPVELAKSLAPSLENDQLQIDRITGYTHAKTDLVTFQILRSVINANTEQKGLNSQKLHKEYCQAIQEKLQQKVRFPGTMRKQPWYRLHALTLLDDSLEAYNPYKRIHQRYAQDEIEFSVKLDLLRLVSQVIDALALYHNINLSGKNEPETTWRRLSALQNAGHLSKGNYHKLRKILSNSLRLRAFVHEYYGYENEIFILPGSKNPEKKYQLSQEQWETVQESYRTIFPLYDMALEFVAKRGKSKCFTEETLGLISSITSLQLNWLQGKFDSKDLPQQIGTSLLLRSHYISALNAQQKMLQKELTENNNNSNKLQQEITTLKENIQQQINLIAQALCENNYDSEAIQGIYKLLSNEARFILRQALVSIYYQTNAEIALKIAEQLRTCLDQTSIVPTWQQQKINWQQMLLKIVEPLSEPKISVGRTQISCALLSADKIWVLKDEYEKQFIEHKRANCYEFIANKELKGSHKVNKIIVDEEDSLLYCKARPEMVGMTFLVETLYGLVFGQGTTYSECVQFTLPNSEKLPVSISNGIHGQTLHDFLQDKNQNKWQKIDRKSFAQQLIMTLLLHLEDGLPANYILQEDGKIISIDHDHALFDTWTKQGKIWQLNLKSILLCFDELMKEGIPFEVKEQFLKLDSLEILESWLRQAQLQNEYYQKFDQQTVQEWHKNKTQQSIIPIPIKPHDIKNIQIRWQKISSALQKEVVTGQSLLEAVAPSAAYAYRNLETKDPQKKLEIVGGYKGKKGEVLQSSTLATKSLTSSLNLTQSFLTRQGELSSEITPEQGLQELEKLIAIEQKIIEAREDLYKGNLTKFKLMTCLEYREKILFGDDKLPPLFFDKIPVKTRTAILELIQEDQFSKIIIKNAHSYRPQNINSWNGNYMPEPIFSEKELKLLYKIIANNRELTQLTLQKVSNLDVKEINQCLRTAYCLRQLTITKAGQLTGILELVLPSLTSLTLEKTAVDTVYLTTPQLTSLTLLLQTRLKQLTCQYSPLKTMEITNCASLEQKILGKALCLNSSVLTEFSYTNQLQTPHFCQDHTYLLGFLGLLKEIEIIQIAKKLNESQLDTTALDALKTNLMWLGFAGHYMPLLQQSILHAMKNKENYNGFFNDSISDLENNSSDEIIQSIENLIKKNQNDKTSVSHVISGLAQVCTIRQLTNIVNTLPKMLTYLATAITSDHLVQLFNAVFSSYNTNKNIANEPMFLLLAMILPVKFTINIWTPGHIHTLVNMTLEIELNQTNSSFEKLDNY